MILGDQHLVHLENLILMIFVAYDFCAGIFLSMSLGINIYLLLRFPLSLTARSDLESVLASIHETIFAENKEAGEVSNNSAFEAFLNSAVFSKNAEGISDKSMSLSDFRTWCVQMPSLRKFLGNLLMPPDSGICYCLPILLIHTLCFTASKFE